MLLVRLNIHEIGHPGREFPGNEPGLRVEVAGGGLQVLIKVDVGLPDEPDIRLVQRIQAEDLGREAD